jgi:hypothetical protein
VPQTSLPTQYADEMIASASEILMTSRPLGMLPESAINDVKGGVTNGVTGSVTNSLQTEQRTDGMQIKSAPSARRKISFKSLWNLA